MILNNEREKTIYKQGYMSGCNVGQYANKKALEAAEHRAEVAERALFYICKETAEIPSYMVAIDKMERLLRQAEKQLAEEKKQ